MHYYNLEKTTTLDLTNDQNLDLLCKLYPKSMLLFGITIFIFSIPMKIISSVFSIIDFGLKYVY